MARLSRRELLFMGFHRSHPDGDEPEMVIEMDSTPTRVPRAEWLPPYLRPPGVVSEGEHVRLCTGCGDCGKACPENAILPLGPAYGAAAGSPAVLPATEPCRLCPDMPCIAACATGALTPTAMEDVRMGVIRVHLDRCWAAMGQPCDYCQSACPVQPPAVTVSRTGAELDEQRCLGCGLCVYYCTATPSALEVAGAGRSAAGDPGRG